jgi:hydrogenase expression/formation protein HypE
MNAEPFRTEAVLFFLPGPLLKWDQHFIKETVGCPEDQSLVEFVRDLPDTDQARRILSDLDRLELDQAASRTPEAGAESALLFLRTKGLRLALISAESRPAVERTLAGFSDISPSDFELIISREQLVRFTPRDNPVARAAEDLGVDNHRLLAVCSCRSQVQAALGAGALAAYLTKSTSEEPAALKGLFRLDDLNELTTLVRLGIPLSSGKLPNDVLRSFLGQLVFDDPAVLINPGIGEDIAAVDVAAEEVLVLKSDPITFVTDSIGQYAVLINANDIATSGATPRWLLTTLLFPCGITASEIGQIVFELKDFCMQRGITLCGGHTEITDAVTRPVVIGMMAGTVAKDRLIDKRNIRTGDRILFTKGVAVEGTAIIAREFGRKLESFGMQISEIETCRRFLNRISIIEEARIAAQSEATSAMHDVTEGGLATALEELSIAGGHRLQVDLDHIPVYPETEKVCRLFEIQPLGLIGSGSLLICARGKGYRQLMADIRQTGIEVACIGRVLQEGRGVVALKAGRQQAWPCFEVDELTHLYY